MADHRRLKDISECNGKMIDLVGRDNILELAMEGKCPHYLLTNPISGNHTYLFKPSELNDWIYDNYVSYCEGALVNKFSFYIYNRKKTEHFDISLPEELHNIEILQKLPIDQINTPPGIYFLCNKRKICYIGQATNVAKRILTHISEQIKEFDSVYFIPCSVNQLTRLETALIRYYQPPYNKTNNTDPNEVDMDVINGLLVLE